MWKHCVPRASAPKPLANKVVCGTVRVNTKCTHITGEHKVHSHTNTFSMSICMSELCSHIPKPLVRKTALVNTVYSHSKTSSILKQY